MALYALGDLHLGQAVDKPMHVFGSNWNHHMEKVQQNWRNTVTTNDVVLVPGDISWAMTLDEAVPDLQFIGRLPGKKVFLRGNHDYWWNGISKVRSKLPADCFAIQNDAVALNGYAICGSRGWLLPSHPKFTPEDETIYQREAGRLKLSLESAAKLQLPMVVMMHYPPCSQDGEDNLFTSLLKKFPIVACVYGHLHGAAHRFAFEGKLGGAEYHLTSADYIDFKPMLLVADRTDIS